MTNMELRKKVIPPKRYEPDLSDGERYMPSFRKPLFRPPSVDFNPHLPPAAFPTLDEPVRTLSELDLETELGGPSQDHLSTQTEPLAQDLEGIQQQSSPSHSTTTPFEAMVNHTLNVGVYPHNPKYYQTLASLESGLSQEEFEWNLREMETSEEDEDNEQRKSAFMTAKIIQSLLAEGKTKEQAMNALGLSTEHWQETVAWDNHRLKVERKEETRIVTMQDEVNSLLLDRDGRGSTSIDSTAYEALFSHHLAAFMTGKMDFSTTDKGDLVNAHNYLKLRGLSPSLVGQWMEPCIGIPTAAEKDSSQIILEPRERQEGANNEISQKSVRNDNVGLKATNKSGEYLVTAKAPRGTKERSPVRRKYVHLDHETPSARPNAISIGQAMNTSLKLPSLKLNNPTPRQSDQTRRPGSIITNTKNVVTQNVMQESSNRDILAPSISSVVKNLAQPTLVSTSTIVSNSDPVEDLSSTTIVVQPKRTWSGTAKTGRKTLFPDGTLQTPVGETPTHNMWMTASGNPVVSKQSSEALERLRIESMKYSGRSARGFQEQNEVNDASTPADVQNVARKKNPKELAVGVSRVPNTAPHEKIRRASTTSSTTKGSPGATIASTTTPTDQSTPATPDLPSSGSSTRSPMATRKPLRYRDGLSGATSPTESITGRRISNERAVPARTEKAGLYSSVYQLGKHMASDPTTDGRPGYQMSAPGLDTSQRSNQGPPEKRQAVRRQSTQLIPAQLIPADTCNRSRRSSLAESVGSIANSIEIAKNVVPKAGGKAPRKVPSKPPAAVPEIAEKTAVSRTGGKGPRKAPSKPSPGKGKAPRKTPSKLPPAELAPAEVEGSDTAKESAKVKVAKAK
ncbi:hypothetical protein MMC11_007742 [Xylographa trunciseda]|nr:hypothetical protein [Xylographa trunciseda]